MSTLVLLVNKKRLCSSEMAELVPLSYSRRRSTHYSYKLHDFSVTIPRCYKDFYANSFFPCTAARLQLDRLWNCLPVECFPLTFDLNGLKSRVDRQFLSLTSF